MHKTPKLFLQILVVFTLASASLSHSCSNYCYQCSSGGLHCIECYKRKLISNAAGIGSSCSSSLAPASDHCVVFDSEGCVQCEQGWASTVNVDGSIGPCTRGTIQNCVREVSVSRQHTCNACLRGYPSRDRSRCIPATQFRNPVPHCSIGKLKASGGITCEQCEPGYINNYRGCIRTPAGLRGCLLEGTGGDRCARCDAKNGYFMRDYGVCLRG